MKPIIYRNFVSYKPVTYEDYRVFAKYIRDCWDTHYGSAVLNKNILRLSTGGWSENEEMMMAIKQNNQFHCACWRESKCGGRYVYELPTKKSFNNKPLCVDKKKPNKKQSRKKQK